ncbi:hypothetical protein AYI68_g297 [Smittium mucronatum]|uniref:Uncharacterized protein n=1 Tax=Smittium mucronatum TaxID=133383 RepID=A0A1R0H8R3_9FUNG|nr:hypothetical protein AYI68_g297 [Smittium mucronatum]
MNVITVVCIILWVHIFVASGAGVEDSTVSFWDKGKEFNGNSDEFLHIYNQGFKDGYDKCKLDRKLTRQINKSRIALKDLEFMKNAIYDCPKSGQCSLDFVFGKLKSDIYVRIQCYGCPKLTANIRCMSKLADKINAGKNGIVSKYYGCQAFGSWDFAPQNEGPGAQILKANESKYGVMLSLPKLVRKTSKTHFYSL